MATISAESCMIKEKRQIKFSSINNEILRAKIVMADAKSRGKYTKHQERLCGGLVLDIIRDGVRQEKSCLEIHLWQDQSQKDTSVQRFSETKQISRYS